jgi:hypothetical protein
LIGSDFKVAILWIEICMCSITQVAEITIKNAYILANNFQLLEKLFVNKDLDPPKSPFKRGISSFWFGSLLFREG